MNGRTRYLESFRMQRARQVAVIVTCRSIRVNSRKNEDAIRNDPPLSGGEHQR